MTTVLALQAYWDWFDRLTDVEAAAVQNVVHKLEIDGLDLGAPHPSAIKGARHALRELRPKQGRSPLRVPIRLRSGAPGDLDSRRRQERGRAMVREGGTQGG